MGEIKRNRPNWDETWMEVVAVFEKRVTCIHYKVGAIIANGQEFIAVGYNGPVAGEPHCTEVGCAKMINGEKLPAGSDRCRGAHAEDNALNRAGKAAKGASLYVSYRPCLACAKRIINAGIKRVVYRKDYDGEEEAINILRRRGVDLIPFSSISNMKLD